ncbi:olfactory receptor family 5 subfamily B member 12B [Mus musculus]|jgi:olfactory receptor|uniref:Olfactory receptor n=1 Tax=Mus musculus TaxID=10090 RepID=Q8VFW9_MOUSE|nr:olfactory receptor family 5 subfamily B member 12B [Mus musculus]AAI38187.1 Olfactory receptor 1445 [Mus musculus]AAL61059.1 olfactory receptor MOR202-7 [Mus musculus]AAP71815.1 olfactory receptor Olfr1445 [Mus musculus]EDL41490.1 mCG66522 [Mus musculus]|eukprot:NP_666910.1 olfactory receptor 1445 [Mus musculus]
MENSTEVTEFILTGLTDNPELQIPLFIVFLLIYLSTVLGNLGMVGLILLDSHLHTPMYLFLSHLSLVDFGYSSAVTPKVMPGLLSIDKTITHNACGTQFFFFVSFITTESFLLAAMAYDRYAAVCKPLQYTTTMTTNTCACLTIGSYVCGVLNSSIHTGNIFRLSFCKFNVIDHFFCDAPPLLALSCSDTSVSEMVILFVVGFNDIFSIVVIPISYLFIFITILRMRSSEGRQKAFSTCASHLTVVFIFYGSGIFMYLQPSSSHTMGTDKMASVFYTMIIPMLNPLVYSLRNKEVKSAFKKAVEKAKISLAFTF